MSAPAASAEAASARGVAVMVAGKPLAAAMAWRLGEGIAWRSQRLGLQLLRSVVLVFAQLPDVRTVTGATIVVPGGLYAFHRERVRARPPA